jgi:hypothetical protein
MDPETALHQEPPLSPTPAVPPLPPREDWGPLPEDVLDEWRWINQGIEEGWFEEFKGKHVAVCDKKVLASSWDPILLRDYVALKYQLNPDRVVIAYIDP